jgi:hypothetical protein
VNLRSLRIADEDRSQVCGGKKTGIFYLRVLGCHQASHFPLQLKTSPT